MNVLTNYYLWHSFNILCKSDIECCVINSLIWLLRYFWIPNSWNFINFPKCLQDGGEELFHFLTFIATKCIYLWNFKVHNKHFYKQFEKRHSLLICCQPPTGLSLKVTDRSCIVLFFKSTSWITSSASFKSIFSDSSLADVSSSFPFSSLSASITLYWYWYSRV